MSADEFDPETAVDQYRYAHEQLSTQETPDGREEWEAIIARLRTQWAHWCGEDSLHRMAFGEPDE